MKTFHVDPQRSFLYSLAFTVIICWQAHLHWMWWVPTALIVWAVFYAANVIYVRANNWIQAEGQRQRDLR